MTREEALKTWLPIIKQGVSDMSLCAEALDMAIKALEQEPCENVPDNDGNIYECSCGYGWDQSKVVRHHFCPNCGRAVDNLIKTELNRVKTELEPCEDAISRQAVIDTIDKWVKSMHVLIALPANEITPLFDSVHELPHVTPQPKMGHWIHDGSHWENRWICSECGYKLIDVQTNYCPNCGAKMSEIPTVAEGSEE